MYTLETRVAMKMRKVNCRYRAPSPLRLGRKLDGSVREPGSSEIIPLKREREREKIRFAGLVCFEFGLHLLWKQEVGERESGEKKNRSV